MKILSYNINGIRAFQRNGKLDQLMQDFAGQDIYCFQEVKCNDTRLITEILESYPRVESTLNMNEYHKGYAGVMSIISKDIEQPEVTLFDIPCNNQPEYTYGRIVQYEFNDFILLNLYVPNSGNKKDLRIEWDEQLREYVKFTNKPFIICGDMNVCATELDYFGNYKRSINTMPGLMDFEIEGFKKLCEECNLVDAYRYLHPTDRKYSWCYGRGKTTNPNRGWRLDYFLVSEELKDKIISCDVYQGYQAPDHSPITLEIDL